MQQRLEEYAKAMAKNPLTPIVAFLVVLAEAAFGISERTSGVWHAILALLFTVSFIVLFLFIIYWICIIGEKDPEKAVPAEENEAQRRYAAELKAWEKALEEEARNPLMPCPYCRASVAKQISSMCPKCGGRYSYEMPLRPEPPPVRPQAYSWKEVSRSVPGCIVVIVIVVLCVWHVASKGCSFAS